MRSAGLALPVAALTLAGCGGDGYVTSLDVLKLGDCDEDLATAPKTNPGFTTPVQVDRGKVRSSLFGSPSVSVP